MIFPSYIFLLVFLPLVLLGWYGIANLRARLVFLTLTSYVFYGWWDWRFTVLMLGSTILDYVCGERIHASDDRRIRKRWLMVSLAGNLAALGFFKYYNFFSDSMASVLDSIGLSVAPPVLNVVLPIGISFYTFQSMSYTIDIYRKQCHPTRDFFYFSAYVSMFPQLVAGPIVRYSEIESQLDDLPKKRVSADQVADGIQLFVVGLVKKIWIADVFAVVADRVFDSGEAPRAITAWVGTVAYTYQLYFDFSGYSDMARGLGRILGFEFPVNFNSPYKSRNIAEFWNRWHITLSHWLRDYLFIPLGGSRTGLSRTFRNLLITMFLGGLWHGAAWNFVIWGLFHGVLLVIHAGWRRMGAFSIPRALAVPTTFVCVMLGWVLFRAPSLARAGEILRGMVGLNGIEHHGLLQIFTTHITGLPLRYDDVVGAAYMGLITIVVFCFPNSDELPRPRNAFWALGLAMALVLTLMNLMKETPFLYFRF